MKNTKVMPWPDTKRVRRKEVGFLMGSMKCFKNNRQLHIILEYGPSSVSDSRFFHLSYKKKKKIKEEMSSGAL